MSAGPLGPGGIPDDSDWRQLLHLAARWTGAVGVGVLIVVVLSAVYAVAPEPDVDVSPWEIIFVGAVTLFVYVTLTLWAILRLQRSRHPVREGGVIVTVLATVIILGYSWVYLAVYAADPDSFSEPLTKTAAVYFTVTVLATVGFGDIVAQTDTARLIVTSQMIIGLTLITLGIRLILQSARAAIERRHRPAEPPRGR